MIIRGASAKLNLFFEILGKRADGYHEIVSLIAPISLHDTLVLEAASPEERWIRIILENSEAREKFHDMPLDEKNLIFRALDQLRKQHNEKGRTNRGACIRLTKRIPSQAGLGGGSSDAASALQLGNEFWNLGLSPEELAVPGSQIGCDVPLFLHECPVIVRGRGEIIEPLFGLPELHFVVLKPPMGLSTAEVYAHCESMKGRIPEDPGPVLEAWKSGDLEKLGFLLFNRLEESAKKIWPNFSSVEQSLKKHGGLGTRMSGSGTAFFSLFPDARNAAKVAEKLENDRIGEVFTVNTIFNV